MSELNIAVMPEKENIELLRELSKQFNSIDHYCFVNELMFYFNGDFNKVKQSIDIMATIIDKVLLDNLFINVNNIEIFTHRLMNKTFSKDIFVNRFYVEQFLEIFNPNYEDRSEIENYIVKSLQRYIDKMFTENDNLYTLIFNIYNYMHNHLKFLNISYFKFELLGYKPVLMYTLKEVHANAHSF